MKKNQKSLRKVVASSSTRRTRRQTLRSALPELLENRTLMSSYLVTNTGDLGSGSLRAAITSVDGDSSAGYDSISDSRLGRSYDLPELGPASHYEHGYDRRHQPDELRGHTAHRAKWFEPDHEQPRIGF